MFGTQTGADSQGGRRREIPHRDRDVSSEASCRGSNRLRVSGNRRIRYNGGSIRFASLLQMHAFWVDFLSQQTQLLGTGKWCGGNFVRNLQGESRIFYQLFQSNPRMQRDQRH